MRSRHLRGVWIEMECWKSSRKRRLGHATYVACGLKWCGCGRNYCAVWSRHLRGVWIEMKSVSILTNGQMSRHLRGVWIEICNKRCSFPAARVTPLTWRVD